MVTMVLDGKKFLSTLIIRRNMKLFLSSKYCFGCWKSEIIPRPIISLLKRKEFRLWNFEGKRRSLLSSFGHFTASSLQSCICMKMWNAESYLKINLHFDKCFILFQPLSHNSGRGGVSLITEKGDKTVSTLMMTMARVTDSGQYACHSSVGSVANVTVHVIRSKWPREDSTEFLLILAAFHLCKCFHFLISWKWKQH